MSSLRVRFPEINSITARYNFYDSETDKLTRATEEKEINLDSVHDIQVKCICWECVNGGYDLSTVFYGAIKDKLTETTGSQRCMGWQDRSRINQHRCYTRLEYIFTITYNS